MLCVTLRPITNRVARGDATSASRQWSSWTSARHDGSFGRSPESTRDRRVNAPWASSPASPASPSSSWQSQETQLSELSFRRSLIMIDVRIYRLIKWIHLVVKVYIYIYIYITLYIYIYIQRTSESLQTKLERERKKYRWRKIKEKMKLRKNIS